MLSSQSNSAILSSLLQFQISTDYEALPPPQRTHARHHPASGSFKRVRSDTPPLLPRPGPFFPPGFLSNLGPPRGVSSGEGCALTVIPHLSPYHSANRIWPKFIHPSRHILMSAPLRTLVALPRHEVFSAPTRAANLSSSGPVMGSLWPALALPGESLLAWTGAGGARLVVGREAIGSPDARGAAAKQIKRSCLKTCILSGVLSGMAYLLILGKDARHGREGTSTYMLAVSLVYLNILLVF
ncbi:hypothetical protein K461DRAFT_56049 [Myriangium duriaei CBS 260.36]|uniref:Uncharacterized protein n=1 Tax=Myriangium duriaei CBS 260.36 TaxID=1168546 RepID=A0A9P4MIP8_9PEZI|nr:hypothetical protein K461DRAFT_56049 [Myriangium duriaei CBS 260.36]